MRIKSFTGANIVDAMNKVRLELGEEAIILATQDLPSGEAQVTAAVEQEEPTPEKPVIKKEWATDWDSDWKKEAKPATKKPKPDFGSTQRPKEMATTSSVIEKPKHVNNTPIQVTPQVKLLVQAMAYHGIPTLLAERICRSALAAETEDTTLALAAALDKHFQYSAHFSRKNVPLMLIGPPGIGKTMTIAKMAASARRESRSVHIITTDTSRAGAVLQLKAFTDILGLKIWVAENPEQLANIVSKTEINDGSHILIDTGGINVYDDAELENLAALSIAARAEPVAVLAAGTDSAEMSETADRLASIGANRLIITRMDTTRRYGGVFTAADSAKLSFSYASVSPSVATGLHVINPVNLARLILRDPTQFGVSTEFSKAPK
ncbi:MAG: AAA family ATPase [Sneathiella sp.]|nr:AAA family ATPase [Sneathiella sp.]